MMKLLLVSTFAVFGVMSEAPSTSPAIAEGHLHVRPPMGITTSLTLGCNNLTESRVLEIASNMKKGGYYKTGYDTVFIGSCWLAETNTTVHRLPKEALKEDTKRFPSGITGLAKKLHAQGMKLGVTIGGGYFTCENRQGTAEHEHQDAIYMAHTNVDYITMDSCYANSNTTSVTPQKFSKILRIYNDETQLISTYPARFLKGGNPADFDWNSNKKTVDISTVYVSESSHPSVQSIQDVLYQFIKGNDVYRQVQVRGAYLDWGPLLSKEQGLDRFQLKSQVTLWALLGAPLVIGSIDAKVPLAYSNAAVVAVAQDRNPTPATFMKLHENATVWGRELENGTGIISIINNSTWPIQRFTIQWASKTTVWTVDELWEGEHKGAHEWFYNWSGHLEPSDSLIFHFSKLSGSVVSNKKQIFSIADFTVGHPSEFTHKGIKQTDDVAASGASNDVTLKSLRDARSTQ